VWRNRGCRHNRRGWALPWGAVNTPAFTAIPKGRTGGWRVVAVAGVAAMAALGMSLIPARALRPPGYFTKYTSAATLPADQLGERAADYSPLYLGLARRVVPRWGKTGLLVINVAAHASTAAATAAVVTLTAGWGWGVATGLAAATYRPFLVYTAVLEPEAVLLALLAGALLAGTMARARGGGGGLLLAAASGLFLGLAGLARPSWLALLPAWALWVAWGQPGGERVARTAATLLGAAAVLAPTLTSRGVAPGGGVLMNPGPVFYEGNGPQATGAPGVQPELVKRLEALRGEGGDWAHVAYRQVAAAAVGREVTAAESNRFWTRLALEHLRHDPALALRQFSIKACYALSPHEFHDLPEAEELDRRLRRTLPWGFGVLLVLAVAGLAGAARAGGAWLGPVLVAMVSLGVQVGFYASARQRLPLALAVLVLAFVGLAGLVGVTRRRVAAFALAGVAVVAATGWPSAPLAAFRNARFSALLGPPPPAAVAAWLDGRAWRPGAALAAERVVLAEGWQGPGEAGRLERFLAPALASQVPWLRGRARLSLALEHAARGEREEAVTAACRAAAEAGGVLLARALCAAGQGVPGTGEEGTWRPAGVDPPSARFALARVLVTLGERPAAARVAAPVLAAFPELASDLAAP